MTKRRETVTKVIDGDTFETASLKIPVRPAAVNAPEPPTLIGYEEPENGIHPERISLVADLFKNQAELRGFQLIVNTHSPTFPECFKDSELFRCELVDGRTEWAPLSGLGPLFKESAIRQSLADSSVP